MSKILHSFLWIFILVSYAEAKPESQFETLKVTIMDNSEKVSDTKEGVLQTTIDMEQGQINVKFSIFEADGSINKQDYTLSRYGLESWFLKTNNQDSKQVIMKSEKEYKGFKSSTGFPNGSYVIRDITRRDDKTTKFIWTMSSGAKASPVIVVHEGQIISEKDFLFKLNERARIIEAAKLSTTKTITPPPVAIFESHHEQLSITSYDQKDKVIETKEGLLWTKVNMVKGYVDIKISIFEKDGKVETVKYSLKKKDSETWTLDLGEGSKKSVMMKSLSEYKGFKFSLAFPGGANIRKDFERLEDNTSRVVIESSSNGKIYEHTVKYEGRIISKDDYDSLLRIKEKAFKKK